MEVTGFALLIAPLLLVTASSSFARDLAEVRYRFTTCGMSGHRGPSLEQCRDFYRENNSPIARDNVLIDFEGYRGAQGFRVPRDGSYNIKIAGATGGRGLCNREVGLGLVTFLGVELLKDYELLVLVGQRGMSPCDIENPPSVCDSPPTLLNETAECNATWYESLLSDTTVNGSFYYPFVGGGGGGGASMVRRVIDGAVGQSVVISGGGGGSPVVLSYEVIQGLTFNSSFSERLAMNAGLNITDRLLYQDFLFAKSFDFDPLISSIQAARGFRNLPSVRPNINAGAGGGLLQDPERPVTDIDGRLLGPQGSSFAEGGSDCASLLSFSGFQARPLETVYGGFGGGGGGCGGGGGGGGVSGGAVVQRGIDIPGGGGYSIVFDPEYELSIYYIDFDLNFEPFDGFVDIVPASCGCIYDCDLDETADTFECLCPSDAQLAPDLSDCYNVAALDLMPGLSTATDPDDFYFTPLTFNATFVFSIKAPVRTTRTSGGQEGACAILFIGQDSEIVLVSNTVSGSGTFDSLAQVVTVVEGDDEENVMEISNLTEFLTSSVLVIGGFLISTQPCNVEGIRIETNASIRDTDTESIEFQAIQDVATNITSEFASRVLQLETSSTMSYTIVIAVVIPIVVVGILVLLLVISLLGYKSYAHKRKKKFAFAQIPVLDSGPENPAAIPTSISLLQDKVETMPTANGDHSYEVLHFEEENESDFLKNEKVISKYGISAPAHDFTDYNKLRSNSHISDWDYPRSNLIFMRNLGEGQFGKVLLMKAKGIAGYEGKIPVAVKTLSSTDPGVVSKFMEEAELMKKFTHPNIVGLLGISFKDEDEGDDSSPLIILEYMPHGDLQNFLEAHKPQEGEMSVITESDLYGFAVDIAKALEFLELNKYVHRDVAARNCLVGSCLRIKIADFGLARGVYDKDYYRVAGRAVLPVRWMAPECLLYGIFTTASDVWSYGVVLYELMTYGELPLENMDVQEIVDEAQNGTLCHSRPETCPDTIYDMMCLCHNHDQAQRPTFTEILATLEKIRSDSCVSVRI